MSRVRPLVADGKDILGSYSSKVQFNIQGATVEVGRVGISYQRITAQIDRYRTIAFGIIQDVTIQVAYDWRVIHDIDGNVHRPRARIGQRGYLARGKCRVIDTQRIERTAEVAVGSQILTRAQVKASRRVDASSATRGVGGL